MNPLIGIDFGTCNTVISYKNKKDKIRSLRYKGEDIIPSVILFKSKSECIVGKEAVKLSTVYPKAMVQHFKTKLHDNKWLYDIEAADGSKFKLKPRAVAEKFLATVMEGINDKLMKEFDSTDIHAVITVPAKFNSTEKENTRKAAFKANISEVRLAPEPTAAAIACQADMDNGSEAMNSVLVYDMGGGTFDVAVIEKRKGVFEEIATGGDKTLGGNTITDCLTEMIMADIADEFDIDFPYDKDELDEDEMSESDYDSNRSAIWNEAEDLKKQLSSEEEADISLSIKLGDKSEMYNATYTRSDFEELVRDKLLRTIEITKNTLKEARSNGLKKLDYIVLAGGSSYIPLISQLIKEEIPEEKLFAGEDFSQLISSGAAILAQNIVGIDDITKNITNVQMGVKIKDGMTYNKFEMLIPENVSLPYSITKEYQLSTDNQRQFEVAYYEYDVKNFPNSIRVDEDGMEEVDTLIVDNLPAGLDKNKVSLQITFTAQSDGSLGIRAKLLDENNKEIINGDMTVKKGSDLE